MLRTAHGAGHITLCGIFYEPNKYGTQTGVAELMCDQAEYVQRRVVLILEVLSCKYLH